MLLLKVKFLKRTRIIGFFFVVAFLSACSENTGTLARKLHIQCQDDLKFIVAEMMEKSGRTHLLDTPYYEILDLRFYQGDSARKYSGYAKVGFYYFSEIKMYRERKFRYDTHKRFWDRYSKEFKHIPNPTD
jgi:hypothetical protein